MNKADRHIVIKLLKLILFAVYDNISARQFGGNAGLQDFRKMQRPLTLEIEHYIKTGEILTEDEIEELL